MRGVRSTVSNTSIQVPPPGASSSSQKDAPKIDIAYIFARNYNM